MVSASHSTPPLNVVGDRFTHVKVAGGGGDGDGGGGGEGGLGGALGVSRCSARAVASMAEAEQPSLSNLAVLEPFSTVPMYAWPPNA